MAQKKVVILCEKNWPPNCYKSTDQIFKHYHDYRYYFQSARINVRGQKDPWIFTTFLINLKWSMDVAMGRFNGKVIENIKREIWQEGDTVEVYRNGYWHGGEIIGISDDNKWMNVEFDNDQAWGDKYLRKEILRDSKYVRAPSVSLLACRQEIDEINYKMELYLTELEYRYQSQGLVLGVAWKCRMSEMQKAYQKNIDILQQSLRKCESDKKTEIKKIQLMTKLMNSNNECFDNMKQEIINKDNVIGKLKKEIKQKDGELYQCHIRTLSQDEIVNEKKSLKKFHKHLIKKEKQLKKRVYEYNQKEIELKQIEDELKQREDQLKQEDECVICMDGSRQIACVPCGHRCLCPQCASGINGECPICRVNVECTIRIYE